MLPVVVEEAGDEATGQVRVVGPEDVEVDRERNRLLVSSQARTGGGRHICGQEARPLPQGRILAIGLDDGHARELALGGYPGAGFHPHGISLVRPDDPSDNEATRLYVVQHHSEEDGTVSADAPPSARHTIEVFRVAEDLVWEERLEAPEVPFLRKPNDLVALPDGRIYVTNPPLADEMVKAAWRGVEKAVVWRDRQGKWHASGHELRMAYPNGIAVDRRRERLFVADTVKKHVRVFRLAPDGSPAIELAPIPVGSGVDNLSWSEDGTTVYVASHPSLSRFLRHQRDVQEVEPDRRVRPSPSEVFAIRLGGSAPRVERIFADPGHRISAASVAVEVDEHLYLGQVFEQGVLRCRLPREEIPEPERASPYDEGEPR